MRRFLVVNSFAGHIRHLLDLRGIKQDDLASAVGVGQSTVSKWVRGRYIPDGPMRRKIAHALGISFEAFEKGWNAPSLRSLALANAAGIPLVNRTAAGYGANYDLDHYNEYDTAWEYIDRGDITDPLAFAVRVVEDSMVPTLADGDLIVLRPVTPDAGSPSLEPGDIVLVRLSGDAMMPNQGTIARWEPTGNGMVHLKKSNPSVQSLLVPLEHIDRVAVAVEKRSKLR